VPSEPAQPEPQEPPAAPASRELRASDAERAQAVELLSRAVADGRLSVDELDGRVQSAYAVPTRRELGELIADVSTDKALDDPLTSTRVPTVVDDGADDKEWVVSILGGHERKGHRRIRRVCNVVNVLGGSEIDLSDAELSGPVTQINVYSVLGGCEIRVPDGVRVEVSKLAVMAGNEVNLGDVRPPAGAPLIRIRLVSIMAGASVERGRKLTKAERRQAREVLKTQRRDELDG
jgi:hypothetical protein